jgi:hypothetical protein
VSLGLALVAAGGTYALACRILRVRELDSLVALGSRLRRA